MLGTAMVALILAPEASATLTLDEAFRSAQIAQLEISPSGEWIVASASNNGVKGLLIQHRPTGIKFQQRIDKRSTLQFRWAGGSTIVMSTNNWVGRYEAHRLSYDDIRGIEVEFVRIVRRGRLVDTLPAVDGEVLWAQEGARLYRVPLSLISEQTARNSDLDRSEWLHSMRKGELALFRERVVEWVVDQAGTARAALVQPNPRKRVFALMYRPDAKSSFEEIRRHELTDDFQSWGGMIVPLAIAPWSNRLIVLAYHGKSTRGLYEFDPESGEITDELIHNERFDIEEPIWNSSRTKILGATYRAEGRTQFEYITEADQKRQSILEKNFPGGSVRITATSLNDRYWTVLVRGHQDLGRYYYIDSSSSHRVLVALASPWIDPEESAEVESFTIESSDNLLIESFLTMPKRSCDEKPPLVVFPHGGPIGVRDDREFNPLTQFLAEWGLAVLQVNYRGSAGYGRDFRSAGSRQWAKGIEDDIDAALQTMIRSGRVDPTRICIAGASYGGYSALVSPLRWPETYKCLISWAGPTDLPLQYDSSIYSVAKEGREWFRKNVGDPETDYEELKAISPLYRAGEYKAKILIIHGSEDQIVNVEHSYRIHREFDRRGIEHEFTIMKGMRHSPTREEWKRIAVAIRDFLSEHLTPKSYPATFPTRESGCRDYGNESLRH